MIALAQALKRLFRRQRESDYELLLRDVRHWLDKYIVDTPDSRTYPGAIELNKRIRKTLPTKQFSNTDGTMSQR